MKWLGRMLCALGRHKWVRPGCSYEPLITSSGERKEYNWACARCEKQNRARDRMLAEWSREKAEADKMRRLLSAPVREEPGALSLAESSEGGALSEAERC